MKILVVEDEPGPREGMCRLLREASPDWRVLEPCSNGVDGARVAAEQHPDLVITDIRMPELDGLDMIAQLRQAGGQADIVVLSGFSDFEYARRCLSLGVREYLVKPVTATVLTNLVRSFEAERGVDVELLDWLEGRGDLDEPGLLCLLRTNAPPSPARRTILRRELSAVTGNPHGSLIVEYPASREVFLWFRGVREFPKTAVDRVLETLGQRLHFSVIGGAVAVRREVGPASANLLRGRLKRFLLEPPPPFLWGEADAVAFTSSLALEKEAVQALQSPEAGALELVLSKFQQEAFREGFDPVSSITAAGRLFFVLQNRLKDLDAARFEAFQAADPEARLEAALDAGERREVFRSVAAILERREDEATPVENLKVQAALTLIKKRLKAPPTLAECAEELGVSPEYLSRLFKAQVGVGYAHYVMNQRIDLAKSVLAQSDETVQRVSVSLGFGNAKYFCAVFRKETGLTPSEYRSRQ